MVAVFVILVILMLSVRVNGAQQVIVINSKGFADRDSEVYVKVLVNTE